MRLRGGCPGEGEEASGRGSSTTTRGSGREERRRGLGWEASPCVACALPRERARARAEVKLTPGRERVKVNSSPGPSSGRGEAVGSRVGSEKCCQARLCALERPHARRRLDGRVASQGQWPRSTIPASFTVSRCRRIPRQLSSLHRDASFCPRTGPNPSHRRAPLSPRPTRACVYPPPPPTSRPQSVCPLPAPPLEL